MLEMILFCASRDETIRQVHTFLGLASLHLTSDVVVSSLQVAVIDAVSQFYEIFWRDLLTRGIIARIKIYFCYALDTLVGSAPLTCGDLECAHAPVLLINVVPRLGRPVFLNDLKLDDSVELGPMQVMLLSVRCVV